MSDLVAPVWGSTGRSCWGTVMWRLGVIVAGAAVTVPQSVSAQDVEAGKRTYDKWCAGCHGEDGAGEGEAAAYMLPRPRDFTFAVYQIRTTASGELPTDDDLRRAIDDGLPGTTMPGWRDRLSARERDEVIAYIKSFSTFFEDEAPPPIDIGRPPGSPSAEDLAEGRRLFEDELQCLRCHGDAGRGDGTSAPDLTDDAGFPIRAADLSENWNFNGGGTVEDIYIRMRTGLDGTPMPSNSDVLEAGIVTDEQLWRTAQYVRSLSPEDPPERRDVVRAALLEGALPTGPDDAAWDGIESYYIPMVGQITIKPRWFAPAVDGIWVQAAHDGQRLALRLVWDDVSASPDPDWDPFFQGVVQTLAPVDEPHVTAQGPDRIRVQFPLTRSSGTELPYFLGGEPRRPVYVVRWSSSPDRIEEGTATGMGSFLGTGGSRLTHAAAFGDGRWALQFARPLVPEDSTTSTTFVPGELTPVAFFAADGTNAEDGIRGSVSAWYAIYLDIPTPSRVYVAPIVATLVTAAFGLVIVWRAQQKEHGAASSSQEE